MIIFLGEISFLREKEELGHISKRDKSMRR
jgi:hypothetical protein